MKNKIITFTFMSFIILVFILNLLSPSKSLSFTERRKLDTFDDVEFEDLLNGKFIKDFDEIALDQFVFRDEFRSLKAFIEFKLLYKSDNNDISLINDHIFKMEYPLNDKYVLDFANYLNTVYKTYLENSNVYYSIIPDKNYFLTENDNFLYIDYNELEDIVTDNISNMTYINIFNELELKDYYKTDPHWKQESLSKVVNKLKISMNMETDFSDIEYTKNSYYPFYGAYYGQSALYSKPDTINYLGNDILDNVIVSNYEHKGDGVEPGIYNKDRLDKMDSYDVFLSGATPLITLENSNANTNKELIIFRDSFTSSIAPLLVEEYSKITLVDLRYVSYKLIGDFVDFNNSDVLFLYSTSLINNSNILK